MKAGDDPFADLKRLLFVSEPYPTLKIVHERLHRVPNGLPRRFRGLDIASHLGTNVQVIQVEALDGPENEVGDGRARHGRKQSVRDLLGVRNQSRMRRQQFLKNGLRLVSTQDVEAVTLRTESSRF